MVNRVSYPILALLILGQLERLWQPGMTSESPAFVHACVEATKQAFRIRDRVITDPAYMTEDPADHLQPARLDAMAAKILPGQAAPNIVATNPVVEDPVAFAMEKHLEDFLVKNWAQTELAQHFKIYEEDGELVGQQYATDAGPIDILAVSKDGQRLLVVELKRGRASDVVVGQILRYMGYVKEQIAEPHQTVEGAIIALDDDQKLRWALLAVPNISFYRYQVSFKLIRH